MFMDFRKFYQSRAVPVTVYDRAGLLNCPRLLREEPLTLLKVIPEVMLG